MNHGLSFNQKGSQHFKQVNKLSFRHILARGEILKGNTDKSNNFVFSVSQTKNSLKVTLGEGIKCYIPIKMLAIFSFLYFNHVSNRKYLKRRYIALT